MNVRQDTTNAQDVERVLLQRHVPWGMIAGTAAVFVLLAAFTVLFYKQTYVGLTSRDGMDTAQVARNIVRGDGFTTRFIRPFNVAMLSGDAATDVPELNHAPLYPYVLAALFDLRNNDAAADQVVSWASIAFLLLSAAATYVLGRQLFGWQTGLLGAAVFGVSAATLKIGVSGELWPMAAFEFTLLLIALAAHHRAAAAEKRRAGAVYAGLAGILLGLIYMTSHVLVLLVVPVAVYFAVTGPARRMHLVVFLVVAAAAAGPWSYRNAQLTGSPVLGISAWDVMADTAAFPGDVFYRSTDPANCSIARVVLFPIERFPSFAEKLMRRSRDFAEAFVGLLGLVALPFAVVSVLYRFKSPPANAIRGLMYGSGLLLVLAFSLFSVSTNALIILAPVTAVFAAAYFLLLLEAKKLHPVFTRALVGGFVLITIAPALASVIWRTDAVGSERETAAGRYFGSLGSKGVANRTYTDVPWTAAWRTNGSGVWLPRSDQDVWNLAGKGLPMQLIILTPECESYQPTETWYVLHRVPLWRMYVSDPQKGLEMMMERKLPGMPFADDAEAMEKELRRERRLYEINRSISGFQLWHTHPLASDDILLFVDRSLLH